MRCSTERFRASATVRALFLVEVYPLVWQDQRGGGELWPDSQRMSRQIDLEATLQDDVTASTVTSVRSCSHRNGGGSGPFLSPIAHPLPPIPEESAHAFPGRLGPSSS